MPNVLVDELKPGLILSKPVLNENGIVLIKENTELTELIIDKLKRMGIESVYVKGEKKFSKNREEMLKALDERFSFVSHNPIMNIIKSIMKDHIETIYDRDK